VINFVSIVLNPFTNDSRVLKECLSAKRAGFNTMVFALHEKGLPEDETVHGFSVHRVRLRSRGWPKQKWIQVIKYLELILRMVARIRNAEIIHANDLNALPIAVILKYTTCRAARVVYDAHEFETECHHKKGIFERLTEITERFFIKYADDVLTVSEGIAQQYAERYGITKPRLVLNCPPYRKLPKKDIFRKVFPIKPEQRIILYQGILEEGRGIGILLETFSRLKGDNICLVLMGYGGMERRIREIAASHRNIFFHPAVPPETLLEYTASADIGIILFENYCLNHYYALPNKFFEYSMAGLPVITSDLPELRKLVTEYQCGFVLEQYSANGLAALLQELACVDLSKYSENAAKMAEIYCWENQEKILLEVYRYLSYKQK